MQFTAPNREQHIANRELGTIERIEKNANLQLRTDSGRRVTFNLNENPDFDYAYAVTRHTSQGQTTGPRPRARKHRATRRKLINRRLAYVAVSRGRYDARIYVLPQLELEKAFFR